MEKTIFITGGLGFIGSNYLNKFVPKYKNYRFINIDCITYAAHKDNILVQNCKNYFLEKTDIRNIKSLERLFKKYKPFAIIHFAAESHVDMSISDPTKFIETNILGTHNLLLLANKYNLKRFHQISTDEVYGSLDKKENSFTTDNPLKPNSPYSASKAGADLLVRSYHKTFGLNTVITRCSNNFGPNQDKSKLLPKTILNLLNNKKIPVYGKGENMRDWIYVEDHIDAIDLVFHKGKDGYIYNIGGGNEISNIDLIKKVVRILGKDEKMIKFVADRKGHDFRYAIDNKDINTQLAWKPKHNFDEALRKTINYYKNKRYGKK